MSIECYRHYENLYKSTKPIRGRSVEVRPIADRRRDFEQIVRKVDANGTVSYAARLHQTDCVEYMPNGDVLVCTNDWATVNTAEFISMHSPFRAWKQNKILWVRNRADGIAYPVRGHSPMRFALDDATREYVPVEQVVINKRVVDRAKAKAAREPLKEFLEYAQAFLTMSDGWVMHQTMKEVLGVRPINKTIHSASWYETYATNYQSVYQMVLNGESHSRVLCEFAVVSQWAVAGRRPVEDPQIAVGAKFYDIRLKFDVVKKTLYARADEDKNVYKTVEVAPGKRALSNVV